MQFSQWVTGVVQDRYPLLCSYVREHYTEPQSKYQVCTDVVMDDAHNLELLAELQSASNEWSQLEEFEELAYDDLAF